MTAALVLAAALNLTGTVTFQREGDGFFFMVDAAGVNWRVAAPAKGPVRVAVGDRVRATGEREPSSKHRLAETAVEVLAHGSPVPAPREVSLADLYAHVMPFGNPAWYGGVYAVEGVLRDVNRRQATTQLLVGREERNFQVELPLGLEDALPADLTLGATVRVTGVLVYTSIENFEEGVSRRIENLELLPASADAVRVVVRAPFWSARRLWMLLGGLFALFAFVTGWAAILRRMVARRTEELAESIRQRETVRIEADASLRERLRLAADLHDGFQQYLAGSMFRLQAAVNYLPEDAKESREQLENARIAIEHAQLELRTTLLAMNAEGEAPESILALFNYVSRRMGHWEGVVEIASSGTERKVARRSAGTLLLILQEAVGNAIRHGRAKQVRVGLDFGEAGLRMTVRDDGTGFEVGRTGGPGHYGLASMERRAGNLGGTMRVESRPGAGAVLTFELPYDGGGEP